MGFDLARFLRNAGSLGTTYFRDQRRADRREDEADDLVRQNTELAQGLYDQASAGYGPSALESLAADPLTTAAQQRVLARYGQISREGWTPEDQAALQQQQMDSRRMEQSQRQGVLDAAARRGDVSGGNTLLAGLMAQQGSANRESERATGLAVAGRQRALDALASEGAMAGQMRSQGVNEQIARGSAMDQFRQWGAGMQQNAAQFLMNARLGQQQNLQQQAADLRATPTFDAAANAVANYYSGGMAGNVAGGGTSTKPSPGPYATPPPGGGAHETGHQKIGGRMAAPTGNPLAQFAQTHAGAPGAPQSQAQRRPPRRMGA